MSIQRPGPTASTSGTTNSTTNASQTGSTSPPQWFLDQWKALLSGGNDLSSNFAYPTMGLMPDQQNASYLYRSRPLSIELKPPSILTDITYGNPHS